MLRELLFVRLFCTFAMYSRYNLFKLQLTEKKSYILK